MMGRGLFQTPGALKFLDRIIEDIHNHRSVIVLLPASIDEQEFEMYFQERLRLGSYLTQEVVSLPDLMSNRMPSALLGELFSVRWPEEDCPRTIEYLLAADNLPDLIYLSRYNALSRRDKKKWNDFVLTWSQTVAGKGSNQISIRPAICLIVSGEDGVDLRVSTDLSIRTWFGFPSALEVQMVCRFQYEYSSRKGKVYGLWQENILPSLVGNDIHLLERLSPLLTGDYDSLLEELVSDARERGWNEGVLKEAEIQKFNTNREKDQARSPEYLMKAYPHLWSAGLLMSTMEWGVELHVSAQALLKQKNQILHRIWRGQLPLILPIIDKLRRYICKDLTMQYGDSWPLLLPEQVNGMYKQPEVPYACELGHLEVLFNSQLRKESRWIPVIRIARKIRNDLAHYKPVLYEDFLSLIQEAGKQKVGSLI